MRAEIRSLQANLRNIPAYAAVYSQEEEICIKNDDVTGQKKIMKSREEVCDLEFIAFAVGLCAILEPYAKCSLDVQGHKLHPIYIPSKVDLLTTELEKLQECIWRDKNLEMAGIGNPKEIIDNLKQGKYIPYVSRGAKNVAAKRYNSENTHERIFESQLSDLGELNIDNISASSYNKLKFSDINTGNVGIVYDEEKLERVEKELQKIVESLLEHLEERVKIPEYLLKSNEAFVNISDWYGIVINEDANDIQGLLESKIINIINNLPSRHNEVFRQNIEDIQVGYVIYLKFTMAKCERGNFLPKTNYKEFLEYAKEKDITQDIEDF